MYLNFFFVIYSSTLLLMMFFFLVCSFCTLGELLSLQISLAIKNRFFSLRLDIPSIEVARCDSYVILATLLRIMENAGDLCFPDRAHDIFGGVRGARTHYHWLPRLTS